MPKRFFLSILVAAGFAGCTHMKGVVQEVPSGRPLPTAVFSVGRPGGIAVYETHHVDERGRFDFMVLPMDLSSIYLYDGAAEPDRTLRHIDSSEMNDHMTLNMRRAVPVSPLLPSDVNVNQ